MAMKHKAKLLIVLTALSTAMLSCLKDSNTTILLNDPQYIPPITEYLPMDLLDLFGEKNVNFGDQPPIINLEFKSLHEYTATNLQPPFSPQPGQPSPITHYHKISNHYLQIADYYCMSSEETYCKEISPIYLMGNGNDFTAYFYESPQTDGRPEHAVLFSGTLTSEGIKNFKYGYKILKYNDSIVPLTVWPANSVFIFKDCDGLAEISNWFHDDLIDPQNP